MTDTSLTLPGYTPTWCAGCGNWGIGRAVQGALTLLNLTPDKVAIMFDIGCSGNMNDFINAYAMHTLHGRALATGLGVKLANHTVPVLVIGGDGGLYGEGGNHFLHACRGNHDVTMIVHDNGVYGLTTGQVSPRAYKGQKGKSTPQGLIEQPVAPLALAITQGATFVAQSFAGNLPHTIKMIAAGIQHQGFSLINILQPCVTFNKHNSYGYFFEHAYEVKDHDPLDFGQALSLSIQPQQEERFPLGIIYQNSNRPAYHQELPQLHDQPLVNKPQIAKIDSLLGSFR